MPLSEYADSIGGGLKLKGVKDGRVKKHKKNKAAPTEAPADTGEDRSTTDQTSRKEGFEEERIQQLETQTANRYGKTEAQLRHEERKRKMVSEAVMEIDRRLTSTDGRAYTTRRRQVAQREG